MHPVEKAHGHGQRRMLGVIGVANDCHFSVIKWPQTTAVVKNRMSINLQS